MLFICCLPFVGTMLIPLLGEYDFEASWSIGKAGLAFNMFEYFLGTLQQSYFDFATMLFPLTFASLPPKSSLNSFRIAHAQDYQSMLLNVFRGINAFWCLHLTLFVIDVQNSPNKKNRCRSLEILPGIPSPFCDREFCSCLAVSNSEMTGNQSPQDTSP